MQLLLAYADDELRLMLKHVLLAALDDELEIVESGDGAETAALLTAPDGPEVALIDWDLPGCSGPDVCRRTRAARRTGPPYLILLALRGHSLAEGFAAGADDCVRIPIPGDELLARIRVGRRYAELPWQNLRAVASGTLWVQRPRSAAAPKPVASGEPAAAPAGGTPQGAAAGVARSASSHTNPERQAPARAAHSRAAAALRAVRFVDDDDPFDAGRRPGQSTIELQSVIYAQ